MLNSLLLKATAAALLERITHHESHSKPFVSLPGRFQSTKILRSCWPSGQSFRRRLRICSGKLPHVPFPPPLTEAPLLPTLPHQCTPLCDVELKPCEKSVSGNTEEGEMLLPSQKDCEWLVIAVISMPYSVSDAITMRPKRASVDVMYFLVGSSHMCFDTLAKSPIVKLNFVLSN